MDKEFAEAFKEEIEKEASTYRDREKEEKSKKKKHFAFGGKKKSRHGESGYGKGEEMDREFAEAFGLEERKMTDGEKEEREEIVKKLKPKLQSFKDRYGDDAKKVMYATATKQAMEEFKIDEGWKKGKYKVTDGKTGKVLGTFNSGDKAQKYVDDIFQKGDYEALTVELDEAVEIEEKKSATGYELYHKTFSDAMQHAYAHAKSKGFVVDPKEIDDKVATGPKKPSSGKTNRYSLKAGRKKVEIQVANLDNKRYELNMYIERVELEENKYDMFDDKPAQELDKEMKKAMKMKSYEAARAHIGDFLIKLDKKYPKSGVTDTEPRSIVTDMLNKKFGTKHKLHYADSSDELKFMKRKPPPSLRSLNIMRSEEFALEEAFSMGKGDKRVVDAFYDQKEIKAHGASILTTDGKTLTKRGMGGQDIAKWVNGKIKIVAVSDVKSTELILKYMKKSIPSGVFEEIVLESTKEYAKSLEKIAGDRQLKMLTKSERENLLKIAELLAKERKEEVEEEMGNVAPTAPDSGGIQYQAPVLGQKKKKKKQTIDEAVKRTTFAGKDVFIVDSETYYNCRLGKKKYGRYEKYVGNGKVGQTIREYGLKYPRRPIILQNGESGPMLFLKYGRS